MRAGPARCRPSLIQNAGGCRSPLPYARHSRYAARYGHECPSLHAACPYARTVSSILPHAGHVRTSRNSGCSVLRQPCRYPHCTPECHKARQVHPLVEQSPSLYRMHPHTERGRDPETGVSSVKGEKHGIIRQENEATSGPSRNRSLYISTGEMSL